MNIKLGDTIEFDYSAPGIHDKHPQIFFLAKVGHLVHGLNQHYLTPQEKTYYLYSLKKIYYQTISTGMMDAQQFYTKYVRGKLMSDSYRTYKKASMSAVSKIPSTLVVPSSKVDIQQQKLTKFSKGDVVKFVSLVRGKLSWKTGTIVGRKVPGANYLIKLDDGTIIQRHPSDLRSI